jgi:uncharacterized membrane protein SpoIIM required for sporulation/uncharacterized RDD family membrane protein YckC
LRTVPAPRVSALAPTVDVETPELVVLTYTIAGVGSRATAALVDYLLSMLTLLLLFILVSMLGVGNVLAGGKGGESSVAWTFAIFMLAIFGVLWGYYVLFEALADGQTPGKRLLRLRVVRDGGYSVTFAASAVRNLLRIIDMQPGIMYFTGIISIAVSKTGKRLGDYAAGTIVVREGFEARATPSIDAAPAASGTPALQTALTDEEFIVLERYIERRGSLPSERRFALSAQLASRFAQAIESREGTTDTQLGRLYTSERQSRARGTAGRRAAGAARERHAIIASGSPRWARFAARLAEAQRGSLASLGERGVREFVAEYRDLTADLARLRTASRDVASEEVFYLSRLVAGAHNLLYRRATLSFRQIVRYLTVDVPREVRHSWAPISLAALLLFGPAIIAFTAVVRHPEVAPTFIPDAMLDRAEQGVERARRHTGYIQDPQVFRPIMASSIVANNVQVTFAAFGGGMSAGALTMLLLVLNGVSLGGIFGLYVSKRIGTLLLAFVAPHGVLELTAICVAGGAGFLLAGALLLPGNRSRRRALVENGRRAIKLIACSSVFLVVAGTLEGFVSPIPSWPLGAKLAVSGATAVAMVFYLTLGRKQKVPVPDDNAPEEESARLLALGADQSMPRALISR